MSITVEGALKGCTERPDGRPIGVIIESQCNIRCQGNDITFMGAACQRYWLPTLISAAFTVTANRQTMLNKIFFIQIYYLV